MPFFRILLKTPLLIAISAISISGLAQPITASNTANPVQDGSNQMSVYGQLMGSGETERELLPADFFLGGSPIAMPMSMEAFAMPDSAAHPSNHFEGVLYFGVGRELLSIRALQDDFGYLDSDTRADMQRLPKVSFELIQHGSHILPRLRGAQTSEHPFFELMLEPGRVWEEQQDQGWSRVAIPFALQEKNANCIHNGVISFLFQNQNQGQGQITEAALQVSSETCLYFKFNLFGKMQLGYQPIALADREALIHEFEVEMSQKMPRKSVAELSQDFAIDASAFGNPEHIPTAGMSLYGVVVEGINYIGGCQTRHGPYPYCDRLVLPSYSLAKSLVAGLAFMRLERMYPDIGKEIIADWVPECRDSENWQDVTFEQTLDMATGNYRSERYMVDEESGDIFDDFFLRQTHGERIAYSCDEYARKAAPGTHWVYHTSDTYILGTALNAYLRSQTNDRADILDDLLIPDIWQPLALSPTAARSIRSYDEYHQPAAGWGLTLLADDVGKLAVHINNQNAEINSSPVLDSMSFAGAMQRMPEDRGSEVSANIRYNQGFWAINFGAELGCDGDLWVPFMSGFGGITLAMFPNGVSYYYFSDQNYFSWLAGAQAANDFRNFCS